MATVMVGVAGTVVIVRLVGVAGARSAGAAMGARPATGRSAGAEAEGLLSQLRNLKYKLVSCGHAKRA